MRMATLFAVLLALAACQSSRHWVQDLERRLPRLGHRNKIAVVDAAYPAQTAPGITTIAIGGDQVEAVASVLACIRNAGHVQPLVQLDSELSQVSESAAPGISQYRVRLDAALVGLEVARLTHEQIIGNLAATAEKFEVLVLKTDLRLPYTSVFLTLDCGYWDAQRETNLRAEMR